MAPTPPPPPERQPTTSLPVPPTAEATAASGSRCEGAALAASIVRTNNLFTIIACDAAGVRRPTGGDEFEVRIHAGGVKLRCGVTDNGDGSYTVSYNPELSGEYSIDVTLSAAPEGSKGKTKKEEVVKKEKTAAEKKKEEAPKTRCNDRGEGGGGGAARATGDGDPSQEGGGEGGGDPSAGGGSVTSIGSTGSRMTKVQYSKLLVECCGARLKKKLADEMRAKSAEDEIFRRGQEERFLGMQQTRVEGTKEERSNVASAVEGLKLQKHPVRFLLSGGGIQRAQVELDGDWEYGEGGEGEGGQKGEGARRARKGRAEPSSDGVAARGEGEE